MERLEKAYLRGEYTPFKEDMDVLQELPTNPLGQLPPPPKRMRKGEYFYV